MSIYSSSSTQITYISLYSAQVLCLFFQQLAHYLINKAILQFISQKLQLRYISSTILAILRYLYIELLQYYYIIFFYSFTSILLQIYSILLYLCAGLRVLSRFFLRIVVLITSFIPIILLYQLRALALLLSFPSQYIILNLYYSNISNYLTYYQFRVLVVVNYTKFLQFIKIVSSKQLFTQIF